LFSTEKLDSQSNIEPIKNEAWLSCANYKLRIGFR
jgi:hypothetical protein